MKKQKHTFHTLIQSLFLTGNLFSSNDLQVYAASCAFGFLFSCFPVIMLTLHILLRFFNISPNLLVELLNIDEIFTTTFQFSRIIESVLAMKGLGIVEVILAISLFWMARRFFASLMNGVKCIFHEATQEKQLAYNLVVLILEVIMVIFFVVVIIILVTSRSLYNYLPFRQQFPEIYSRLHTTIISLLPFILMFFCVTFCYHYTPGTKPKWSLCIIFSAICSISFFGFLKVFTVFLNMTRYNLVYGVLSNIIILLLDVFTFFILFLFFLQAIFVFQFFEELLLAELYLLPPRSSTKIIDTFRRLLFIKPDYFIFKNPSLMEFQNGQIIYEKSNNGNDVYFIMQGVVELYMENNISTFERGSFFGEVSCFLHGSRNQTAKAKSKVVLVRIPAKVFFNMLDKSSDANKRALAVLSTYLTRSANSSSDSSL